MLHWHENLLPQLEREIGRAVATDAADSGLLPTQQAVLPERGQFLAHRLIGKSRCSLMLAVDRTRIEAGYFDLAPPILSLCDEGTGAVSPIDRKIDPKLQAVYPTLPGQLVEHARRRLPADRLDVMCQEQIVRGRKGPCQKGVRKTQFLSALEMAAPVFRPATEGRMQIVDPRSSS
ncbi:hypothetical protein ACFPOB_12775 [Bosea eneae]|uniref:Uncharacterized protein n=1 Tax=Bosea eneae TaxID=151454 RepID=A0ABW0IQV0_9HYPH